MLAIKFVTAGRGKAYRCSSEALAQHEAKREDLIAKRNAPVICTAGADCAMAVSRDLAAARLSIERARARVRQATLFPNPSLDLERTTGSWTNSKGESETVVGLAVPIELGGKRSTRSDL